MNTNPARLVMTVSGPLEPSALGITDAHQHTWIAPVPGVAAGAPRLDDRAIIAAGLARFRAAGGGSLLDCQPGGCGRDGRVMRELSRASGVPIIAATGFHLQRYYPADYWLWQAGAPEIQAYLVDEIRNGLAETRAAESPVRAGFIKIACTAELGDMPAALLQAAAGAVCETGVALLIHTEQGNSAEQIVTRLAGHGAPVDRLVLCHIDKRPDFGLHRELAQGGVLLEYDTWFRPKYQPERNVWPLLEQMVGSGLAGQVAIGTDMVDPETWRDLGPAALVTGIMPRLEQLGFDPVTIRRLTGQNIAERVAVSPSEPRP